MLVNGNKCLSCYTLPDDRCCRTVEQALFELGLQRMSVSALNLQITLSEINILLLQLIKWHNSVQYEFVEYRIQLSILIVVIVFLCLRGS